MALPRRETPRALTASASRLRGSSTGSSPYSTRMAMPWQYQALTFYDLIPELHFASHFLARMMSRVRFFPALLSREGTLTPITSGPPVDLLNRIQDPGGGTSQLQYRYGLLSFVTGEGVLFGYNLSTPHEAWKFLWRDEVKIRDDGVAVRLTFDKRETDEIGVGYRLWNPHPRHSDLADSPVRATTQICEELIILTASVHGTATTRLTNGLLFLPSELSPGAAEPLGDEDAEANIFLADLTEHFQSQIEDPGSAASKVPFVLEGAYEFSDGVKWLNMHDPQTDYAERELRKEAVQRLALGLDMPPEALLGMTDANHWTAKQVMHDMWRTHGIPKAEQYADDLNQAYLKRALEFEEYPDWEQVVVAYDDSQVVISPDRTDDADQAYDRGQLNDPAYAELKGFPASYAASEEDKKIWLAIKMRDPNLLKGTKFYVEPIAPTPGPFGPEANGAKSDPTNGPPAPTAGRSGSRQESRTASAHILGAADMALMRCRKLAGVRIRHKCKDCAEGHPDAVVASIVGAEGVGEPRALVNGGTEEFLALLEEIGVGGALASSLAQTLEVYAARTLFNQKHPELPAAFMAQVESALEVSEYVLN